MITNAAKRAMTTKGQKACYVIDHLVKALGGDPSSSLRRALILADIDQHPGTTQTGIMERLQIGKSSLSREIEWLFNYGCIMRQASNDDGRETRLVTWGYSKKSLASALDYFNGDRGKLRYFIEQYIGMLKQEKPTLRDAKIISTLYDRKKATKQQIIDSLYRGAPSTDHRAINQLIEEGKITDGGAA